MDQKKGSNKSTLTGLTGLADPTRCHIERPISGKKRRN